MTSNEQDLKVHGVQRAIKMIDALDDERKCRSVQSIEFARIIVGLFPDWFDFGVDKFAVLAWDRGLHIVVSGPEYGFVLISTSDSRCMSCNYLGATFDNARIDMHYQPSPEQIDRATTVIRLALTKLFSDQPPESNDALVPIPGGKVFPDGWDGSFNSPPTCEQIAKYAELDAEAAATDKAAWWKFW